MSTDTSGRSLFIADNSVSGWTSPIELAPEDGDSFRVIVEFLEVVRSDS